MFQPLRNGFSSEASNDQRVARSAPGPRALSALERRPSRAGASQPPEYSRVLETKEAFSQYEFN